MNWQSIPLNKSKLFITGTLHGGCDIFIPIKEGYNDLDIIKVKRDLHTFIFKQKMELARPPQGDDAA